MRKNTQAKPIIAALNINRLATFAPIKSQAEATADFIASFPNTKDGENGHLKDFLIIARMVVENYETFTAQDFFTLLKSKDLPAIETKTFFEAWTVKMLADGRLKKIAGAYEYEIFQVV